MHGRHRTSVLVGYTRFPDGLRGAERLLAISLPHLGGTMGIWIKATMALVAAIGVGIGVSSAQGANAQMIADRVMQNATALRAACPQGEAGVSPLVRQAIGELMREGKQLNPNVDGPAAGQILAARCRAM